MAKDQEGQTPPPQEPVETPEPQAESSKTPAQETQAVETAEAAEQSSDAEAQASGTESSSEPTEQDIGQAIADLIDQDGSSSPDASSIDMLNDVDLNVKIELGRARMRVEDVLKLGEGSVVELDKLAGDPVDIYVNNRLMARGEVLVLNDNFCVRVSSIVKSQD